MTPPVEVLVTRLDPDLPLPAYEHPGDAGLDLRSRVDVTLAPGERALVPTGVAIALPAGCAAFVCPRSGLALRHGVGLVNAPGVNDAGYRGEIGVILINHGGDPFTVRRGERIAQLVVAPVSRAVLTPAASLEGTARGAGGFGSSGRQ